MVCYMDRRRRRRRQEEEASSHHCLFSSTHERERERVRERLTVGIRNLSKGLLGDSFPGFPVVDQEARAMETTSQYSTNKAA
jgi:hypothetical protein